MPSKVSKPYARRAYFEPRPAAGRLIIGTMKPSALLAASAIAVALGAAAVSTPAAAVQTDLDAFMREVVARRDDNWKKLQQYVLDERELIELRGPSREPL